MSSVFVPSVASPAGRIDTLASTRSEPSSMFTSETPMPPQRGPQQAAELRGLGGGAQVGLGHDLHERRAAAVEVDDARLGAVDAARWRRRGRASPRPPRGARGGCARRRGARRGKRDVVLADLVALGQVGIEVVLAVEDRARRDLAAEAPSRSSAPKCTASALVTGSVPGWPRQTGQVWVLGVVAEGERAAAEHLRPRLQLHVDLDARSPARIAGGRSAVIGAAPPRTRSPARARARRRGCGSR